MSYAANFFFLAGSSLMTQWLSSGCTGTVSLHGAFEQAGKVGDIRDTYLLCGLRDRVMMIPEQVRRKSSAAPASQAQHHRGGRRPADDFPARSGPPASGC